MTRPSVDPFHARVAHIALAAAREHGFALGGGLALLAHGVLDRPTEDIDMFSDQEGSVLAAAQLVRTALEAAGIEVQEAEDDSELNDSTERKAKIERGDGSPPLATSPRASGAVEVRSRVH